MIIKLRLLEHCSDSGRGVGTERAGLVPGSPAADGETIQKMSVRIISPDDPRSSSTWQRVFLQRLGRGWDLASWMTSPPSGTGRDQHAWWKWVAFPGGDPRLQLIVRE